MTFLNSAVVITSPGNALPSSHGRRLSHLNLFYNLTRNQKFLFFCIDVFPSKQRRPRYDYSNRGRHLYHMLQVSRPFGLTNSLSSCQSQSLFHFLPALIERRARQTRFFDLLGCICRVLLHQPLDVFPRQLQLILFRSHLRRGFVEDGLHR